MRWISGGILQLLINSVPFNMSITSHLRFRDITGQSLPVLIVSRMMDVLWSDLHMTHQSRSSKSGDSFYRPSAPPELKRS
jgi:hypothetical protein